MRNTGGNKYEMTAGEIQFDQFSTFFGKPKMTSRKVTPTAVNVKVKKILTTFSCPLACVGTNLAAICPMEVRLPSEKLILPYFSSPRGVATLDCDSHSQAGSTRSLTKRLKIKWHPGWSGKMSSRAKPLRAECRPTVSIII